MPAPEITLDAIARPSGGLAMVAMDQRESLRTMFADAGRGTVGDEVLVDFKLEVARHLGPLASGFLIDRQFGFDAVRGSRLLPADTGLILAVDALEQEPGGPVEDTSLDLAALAPDFDRSGVVALKLLLIWRRDPRRDARRAMAAEFAATARLLGLVSVLEPVVRPTQPELDNATWDADQAIREAAEELSTVGQSLYKVQVPRAGRGSAAELASACRALDTSISGPWVVLSQGVAREDFLGAVTAACHSGASGFLAGRALWSDVVGTADVPGTLREVSVPRLQRLAEVVDRYARPWRDS